MNEKKRIFHGYFPFDYKTFQQELEENAAGGWILDRWGRFTVTYKHTGNTRLKPRLDIFTGAYENNPEEKIEAYRKRREKAGWKYAAESDFFYVWYGNQNAAAEAPTPEQEKDLCHKMAWSRELYIMGFTLVILFFGAASLWKMAYTDFLTFSGLGSLLIAPVFILPAIWIGVYELRFYSRCKQAILRGEGLQIYSGARTRYRWMYALATAEAVFVALMFLLDACFGYVKYLLLLLPILAALGAVFGLKKLPQPALRRPLSILALIVCGCALWGLRGVSTATDGKPLESTAYASITAMEETAESTSYTKTVSVAVPYHYVYTEKAEDGAKLSTEYFRIPADWVQKLVLQAVQSSIRNGKLTISDANAGEWNADTAYLVGEHAVLLIKGDEIYYYAASDSEGNALTIEPDWITE